VGANQPIPAMTLRLLILGAVFSALGCNNEAPPLPVEPTPGTFGYDVAFLQSHTDAIVLTDSAGEAKVAVVPSMQGRVMTSTASGDEGLSLGWINYDLIASGDTLQHMNPYGGEDRFWIGPEGGQFSVFFAPGKPFDLEHWFTPAPIDTEPFDLLTATQNGATFGKTLTLTNYSGTIFDAEVVRTISLISRDESASLLGVDIGESLKMVAFSSTNTLRNAGETAWSPETGLLSIWILGMFNPSPATTVVAPFAGGTDAAAIEELGPIVNDAYFGKVPADRLIVSDGVLFFKGDGEYRGKIGLSATRAKPIIGSYDATNKVLTLVQFSMSADASRYVNSMWEIQDAPYAGDVSNSYNDGPLGPGQKGLGPFYELETSSAAAALDPGEELTHIHRTFHFQALEADLDALAQQTLGVSLKEIKAALVP